MPRNLCQMSKNKKKYFFYGDTSFLFSRNDNFFIESTWFKTLCDYDCNNNKKIFALKIYCESLSWYTYSKISLQKAFLVFYGIGVLLKNKIFNYNFTVYIIPWENIFLCVFYRDWVLLSALYGRNVNMLNWSHSQAKF